MVEDRVFSKLLSSKRGGRRVRREKSLFKISATFAFSAFEAFLKSNFTSYTAICTRNSFTA